MSYFEFFLFEMKKMLNICAALRIYISREMVEVKYNQYWRMQPPRPPKDENS
jgi:hypothetical protein